MKSRRLDLEKEAKRLMGMSGVQVYERKIGWLPQEHFFDIVWRDKKRWAVDYPWDSGKHVLFEIGCKLRNRVAQEEEWERAIKQSEVTEENRKRDNADTIDVMTREVLRTTVDKPQYYY